MPATKPVRKAAMKPVRKAATKSVRKAAAQPAAAKVPPKAVTKAPRAATKAPAKAAPRVRAKVTATWRPKVTAAGRATVPPPAPPSYAARPWLASYPPDVPSDPDIPVAPLTKLLDDAAASFPNAVALAFLGTKLTYRDLKDSVDRFAAALAGLGVHKGDRVAVVLPNCPQNVITCYAAWRLGAVVVQHNPLYTEVELEHQLADSGATVVVCLDRSYAAIAAVREHTALREVIVTSLLDYLPGKERLSLALPLEKAKKRRAKLSAPMPKGAPARSFLRMLAAVRTPARQTPVDPTTDPAVLQYTGGTTGIAKGAILTHANLFANAWQNRLWIPDATPGREVTLAVLPLFHSYGLTVCMNTTMLLAGTLVLLYQFDLSDTFQAIKAFRPTLFPGVPTIYRPMIDSPEIRQHDLTSIRACISGAMALPTDLQEQFERVSGGRLVEGYGLTEASPATHANPIYGKRKAGTIGLPLPATQCRIVSREDPSVDVPFGTAGELLIRGPQVFSGYWRHDDESAFADGWLRTGDVAVMDEDGYFTIVDRIKDIIITGGHNVYPSEVEDVLRDHPGVADCCVAGIPDRFRGEMVKAYVVRRPGSVVAVEELVEHCAESLAPYKVPKAVEFRDTLPRTVVGKVLRRLLVEEERRKAAAESLPEPPAAPARSIPGGRR